MTSMSTITLEVAHAKLADPRLDLRDYRSIADDAAEMLAAHPGAGWILSSAVAAGWECIWA